MNNLEKNIMEQNRHQFIYGYNTSERQMLLDNLIRLYVIENNVDKPIGIYLSEFNMEFNDGRDKIRLYSIAREFLTFNIIYSILKEVLNNCALDEEDVNKFLNKINHVYLKSSYSEIKSLNELLLVLKESMEFYNNYYEMECPNISNLKMPFLDLTMVIKNIKKMINNNSYFAIIINGDNISNITKLAINNLLGSRINKDISMKIFCEPGSWNVNYDFNGNIINNIHDYGVVNFDESEREYTRILKNNLGGSSEV